MYASSTDAVHKHTFFFVSHERKEYVVFSLCLQKCATVATRPRLLYGSPLCSLQGTQVGCRLWRSSITSNRIKPIISKRSPRLRSFYNVSVAGDLRRRRHSVVSFRVLHLAPCPSNPLIPLFDVFPGVTNISTATFESRPAEELFADLSVDVYRAAAILSRLALLSPEFTRVGTANHRNLRPPPTEFERSTSIIVQLVSCVAHALLVNETSVQSLLPDFCTFHTVSKLSTLLETQRDAAEAAAAAPSAFPIEKEKDSDDDDDIMQETEGECFLAASRALLSRPCCQPAAAVGEQLEQGQQGPA